MSFCAKTLEAHTPANPRPWALVLIVSDAGDVVDWVALVETRRRIDWLPWWCPWNKVHDTSPEACARRWALVCARVRALKELSAYGQVSAEASFALAAATDDEEQTLRVERPRRNV